MFKRRSDGSDAEVDVSFQNTRHLSLFVHQWSNAAAFLLEFRPKQSNASWQFAVSVPPFRSWLPIWEAV